ncbi:MAG: response regulator, partial [Pseudomonadota bacterium]
VVDRASVIRGADGRPLRMIGSMLDVTESRTLDERLRQAQKMEAVGHLTGGVAHDFNNLLTVIIGNAEFLTEGLEGSPLQELASMTAAAAERGAQLTSRLLAFARRQPLQPRAVDVDDLLRSLDALLRRTLPETIDIQLSRADGTWAAHVDPGQLEAAILNLAINARDAMPGGGSLTIETANAVLDADYARIQPESQPGAYVALTVTDTGSGMTPDVAARAFDPFFTTKPVGKGSGLGLSMVYGFAKQSGGHARLYSEPGVGTAVRLYLPRDEAAGRTDAAPTDAALVPRGDEHVLVVEDDDLVRAHVQTQLRTLGYRVTTAADAPAALRLMEQTDDVDLLFTDVVMPGGMNGADLAREAQRRWPGLKVLFTSGYTENAIVHHGRLDAGVELLSKPYRRADLARKLRHVLDDG